MKVYKVKVNGKVYEVELESVSVNDIPISVSKAQNEQAVSSSVNNMEVKNQMQGNKEVSVPMPGSKEVKAPMQGNILDIRVAVGDTVKKGQCVCILEAMKLENEIVSPVDGTVKQILVNKGQTVNNLQILLIIG